MEQIKNFLDDAFLLEQIAADAERYPDLNAFNEKFDSLMTHSDSRAISFEMARMTEPLETFMYEAMQQESKPLPRHIFKISKYNNLKYQEIFACYVSARKPQPNYLSYSSCYWVGWVDNKLKFVTQYSFGHPDLLKSKWMFTGGDREITFESVGNPVEILRLLPPKDDEDSLEDYLKDR